MKNLSVINFLKYFTVTLLLSCFQLICLGQDSGTTSTTVKTTTTEHREWYTVPWVWVVGGIIVILLLVAILSSGCSFPKGHRVCARGDREGRAQTCALVT